MSVVNEAKRPRGRPRRDRTKDPLEAERNRIVQSLVKDVWYYEREYKRTGDNKSKMLATKLKVDLLPYLADKFKSRVEDNGQISEDMHRKVANALGEARRRLELEIALIAGGENGEEADETEAEEGCVAQAAGDFEKEEDTSSNVAEVEEIEKPDNS